MDNDHIMADPLAVLQAYYAAVQRQPVVTPPWMGPQLPQSGRLSRRRRLTLVGVTIALFAVAGVAVNAALPHGPNLIRQQVGSLLLVEEASAASPPPVVTQSQADATALRGAPRGYHVTNSYYTAGLVSASNASGIAVTQFGKPVAVWVVELVGTTADLNGVTIVDAATGNQLVSSVVTRVVPPS